MNLTTGKSFDDGAYILYVNGEYRGDSDVSKLMHDFNCTDAGDSQIELLAQRTRYLKETPEGVDEMCKEMEIMRDKSRAEGELKKAKETVMNLHTMGLDMESIARAVNVSLEQVKQWITTMSA